MSARQPAAQPAGRGRGPAGPPQPTPRLADGTPNLGRVPGEKGVWNVPYITNMGQRIIEEDGKTYVEKHPPAAGRRGAPGGGRADAPLGGGEGTGGGGRGGAKSEPQVPFQPWAAAVYDYNSANQSKYDPEGYCLPPGGPRMMATPYPMEIIQLPEQKRIIMIFEGATHIWREIYMDGRPHPQGDELNPTYLGHSVGRWEGDTLVVDIVGFNEQTWIDYFGHPHTDMLHVVEKYSRPNKNTLALRGDVRRSRRVHEAVHGAVEHQLEPDRRADRVHLPGEQQVPAAAHRRLRPTDLREKTIRIGMANGELVTW